MHLNRQLANRALFEKARDLPVGHPGESALNSSSFDQILRQVFIVPVVVVLLGAGALAWQMNQAYRTVAHIESADETITRTEQLETLVVDQETGLRGYQTTGDSDFLAPYNEAVIQIPVVLDQLRAADSSPRYLAAVDDLRAAHDTWEAGFAEPLISTIEAGAQTSDVDLNLLGKTRMDDVRRRILSLAVMARQQRDGYIKRWRYQVRLTVIALAVFAILIGAVIGLYTRRQLQDVSNAFRQAHNILRIRAEQTFRSEQKLRTTLQSIGDGVITCDAEGCVETMNDVAQQLTGWTAGEARNQPLEEVFRIISQITRKPKENPVAQVQRLNRSVVWTDHTILIKKDGSEIFIDDSGAPIRDKQGKLIGIVLVFRDITMAIKSQEALLANEKLAVAGRLAATIAHEIHNPLDSVSNLLFLMDGQSTPQENAQFLELARAEIARVTQISRAMLSLYREAKAPVAIDIKEMLESILLLMERRFVALGVSVVPDLPEGLIVHGFPAELRQVFTNLLTNAAEASSSAAGGIQTNPSSSEYIPPSSIIRLRAQACPTGSDKNGLRREPGVMVNIEDTGGGVPEAILDNLFKPFFTTKGERGTGLGLWVSRGIMTKHGGSIDLESSTDPEHHGTTVSVFLATNPVINAGGD
jgi:PAS domain S-box-containing protein